MRVIVYPLREEGRPLAFEEILARPRLEGELVYGTWGNPEEHARLLHAGGQVAAQLSFATVRRISRACLLLTGFDPSWPGAPLRRQTWLCALDEGAGEAALRKVRAPRSTAARQA